MNIPKRFTWRDKQTNGFKKICNRQIQPTETKTNLYDVRENFLKICL